MKLPADQETNPDDNTEQEVTPTKRNISITVMSGETAVGSATVTIEGTTRTTGNAGGCTFSDITDGNHTVSVTAEGYTSKTEQITVSENATSFTIKLTES